MTKARDIATLLSTANGKIAGENLDVSFENISDTGTEGTKVASGTTAQRGSTQGQLRFNTTTALAEYYTGTTFKAIDSAPTVSSVTNSNITDTQITANFDLGITGSAFNSGATVKFIGNDGTEYASPTVTVNSETSITARVPTSVTNANEPFDVKVTNTSGLSATLDDAFNINASPTWSTASGQIGGTITEQDTVNTSVSASDPEGSSITYSVQSGSLPSGLSLNTSTGAITGTASSVSSDTTSSFTLRASDGTNTTDRAFSMVVNNDPLLDGLIAWYKTGGETDSSGNSRNGTFSGSSSGSISTVTDSGTPLGSRSVTSYPDSNGYCALPLSTIVSGTNARTITCWVKPNGTLDSSDYIFGFGLCAGSAKGTFNARAGSQKMGFMGCGADYDNSGATVYSSGTWVRIFYTFTGTNTVTAYYLDGSGNRQQSWSQNLSGLSTQTSSGATAQIGGHSSNPNGDNGGCNSRIADFRIYNRELTSNEMESLYNK
jgi:hypothetical protein